MCSALGTQLHAGVGEQDGEVKATSHAERLKELRIVPDEGQTQGGPCCLPFNTREAT